MSLRRDVQSAFDEISPSMLGLPERVVQTVLIEIPTRRRERIILRLRVPLSLVAAFMLITLVVGLLIGSRLIQDWNSFHYVAPAGSGLSVAQLEARPLLLPSLQPSDVCPDGPEANGLWGSGPVYGAQGWAQPKTANELNGNFSTRWGDYSYKTFIVGDRVSGPILARGKDLRTNQPIIFVGNYAIGSVVGTDTVDGKMAQQHLEEVLDVSHPPAKPTAAHKLEWPVIVGMAKGGSDCVGFQFDGPDFTEAWVVYVLLHA